MSSITWNNDNKNKWNQWLQSGVIMRFNYKTIPVIGIKQTYFMKLIKVVLTQNIELESMQYTFDSITYCDWLNQINITITEPKRTGIRRNGTLYTCLQIDKLDQYIKSIRLASFKTDDIETYEERMEMDDQILNSTQDEPWINPEDDSESEEKTLQHTPISYNINNNSCTLSVDDNHNNRYVSTTKEKNLQHNPISCNINHNSCTLSVDDNHNNHYVSTMRNNHENTNIQQYNSDEAINKELIQLFYNDKEEYTDDETSETQSKENDIDSETTTCLLELYTNINKWRNELQENNKHKYKGRSRATLKRNNSKKTKEIMDHIETIRELSYPYYCEIIQKDPWIQNAYIKYREKKGKVTPALTDIIISSNTLLNKMNSLQIESVNNHNTRKRKIILQKSNHATKKRKIDF